MDRAVILFRFGLDHARFRKHGAVRLRDSGFVKAASHFGFDRSVILFRLGTDNARLLAVFARRPQLCCVTPAYVNGFAATLFPAQDDWRSVVALKPVICGKSFRRLSGLESPFRAAHADSFRHVVNFSEAATSDVERLGGSVPERVTPLYVRPVQASDSMTKRKRRSIFRNRNNSEN